MIGPSNASPSYPDLERRPRLMVTSILIGLIAPGLDAQARLGPRR
jgi:hypothetical protein